MQIHQHRLLELCLTIVDRDGIVVSVETVDKGLNGGFVYVSDVGCRLPGFLALQYGARINQTEGINHNFAFDGLDGVNNHSDSTRVKRFKRLARWG